MDGRRYGMKSSGRPTGQMQLIMHGGMGAAALCWDACNDDSSSTSRRVRGCCQWPSRAEGKVVDASGLRVHEDRCREPWRSRPGPHWPLSR